MGHLVHQAYVVGGHNHTRSQIEKKLLKDNIDMAGHAVHANGCTVPKKATFVLIISDIASHPLTDKAKEEAKLLNIPIVMGVMGNWSLTRQRLMEHNIVETNVANPDQGGVSMGHLVHWAYVAGAREHLRAQIKTKLWKDDINLSGHAVDARECVIPKKTTFVLILADLATHSLTDKARAEAKRLDLPIVMGAMSNWTLTRQRLAEFNIVAKPPGMPTLGEPVIQSAEYRAP